MLSSAILLPEIINTFDFKATPSISAQVRTENDNCKLSPTTTKMTTQTAHCTLEPLYLQRRAQPLSFFGCRQVDYYSLIIRLAALLPALNWLPLMWLDSHITATIALLDNNSASICRIKFKRQCRWTSGDVYVNFFYSLMSCLCLFYCRYGAASVASCIS